MLNKVTGQASWLYGAFSSTSHFDGAEGYASRLNRVAILSPCLGKTTSCAQQSGRAIVMALLQDGTIGWVRSFAQGHRLCSLTRQGQWLCSTVGQDCWLHSAQEGM